MMKPKLLIRSSALLILVHLLGHTMGHMNWDDEKGPLYGVVKEMKSHHADFMGATKSMADYYNGYSLILFGLFGMTILVLWILSNHVVSSRSLVKQLLYPIGVAYVFFGMIEAAFFFPFAAGVSAAAGLLLLAAAFGMASR